MKIRSQGAGQAEVAGRVDAGSADARARGQQLLKLAGERSLVPTSLIGVPKASLDALAEGLLAGAVLAVERRGAANE